MTAYKQSRILFLILALLVSVTTFGQNICTKTLPCSKLDSAQADIEKGRLCEEQRRNDAKIIKDKEEIIEKLNKTISDDDKEKIRLNLKITELEDKVKRRGRQRFTWSSITLAIGRILSTIK